MTNITMLLSAYQTQNLLHELIPSSSSPHRTVVSRDKTLTAMPHAALVPNRNAHQTSIVNLSNSRLEMLLPEPEVDFSRRGRLAC